MAKISQEARHNYFEKIKPYKDAADAILARERNIILLMEKDPNGSAYKRLTLADEMLNLASYYMVINGISVSVLGVKNEEQLNEARKTLYKAIIYLEETVSNYIDVPYSEYSEKLKELEGLNAERRYALIRKLGLAIRMIEDAYGENTKWKWAFVELEGRFATVAKNIFDLKNAIANFDPRSPDYEVSVYHMRTIKRLLMQAADRYREKYELSTNRIDDFKLAINYLGALRRIHILLGERDEAETVKKKQDIWTAKLEADQKKKENPYPLQSNKK
ncbi:MAG: hypothetical protein SNJ71_01735 [Bacteroidales bacterium]